MVLNEPDTASESEESEHSGITDEETLLVDKLRKLKESIRIATGEYGEFAPLTKAQLRALETGTAHSVLEATKDLPEGTIPPGAIEAYQQIATRRSSGEAPKLGGYSDTGAAT